MDYQILFNVAVALVGALGGYVLHSISNSLSSLQKADTALTEKVQKMEVLVAGEYVKESELDKLSIAIFNKLDKIENKLDGKVDK